MMMRRYKRKRKLEFILLVIGICVMSVGFAAFSDELTIASTAMVKPDSNAFKVVFSSSGTEYLTNKVTGVATGSAIGGNASIDNTGDIPTIGDLTATFSGPGESVKYEFYVYNSGAYQAYLNEIKFNNVSGESSSKVCTAIDSSSVTNSLMQSACNDINVSVEINDNLFGASGSAGGMTLAKGAYEKVIVTISYTNNDNLSDGDFTVEFGDIGLVFSTVAESGWNSEIPMGPGDPDE